MRRKLKIQAEYSHLKGKHVTQHQAVQQPQHYTLSIENNKGKSKPVNIFSAQYIYHSTYSALNILVHITLKDFSWSFKITTYLIVFASSQFIIEFIMISNWIYKT